MTTVLSYVLVSCVRALQIMMFARAILSWFPNTNGSPLSNFLVVMTEPIIAPVRFLLGKFESLRSIPIDIPFFVTLILLSFIA